MKVPEPFKSLLNASAIFDFNTLKRGVTMANFLGELEKATTAKEWTPGHGTRPTVIVVDEANALKQMANQSVSASYKY